MNACYALGYITVACGIFCSRTMARYRFIREGDTIRAISPKWRYLHASVADAWIIHHQGHVKIIASALVYGADARQHCAVMKQSISLRRIRFLVVSREAWKAYFVGSCQINFSCAVPQKIRRQMLFEKMLLTSAIVALAGGKRILTQVFV